MFVFMRTKKKQRLNLSRTTRKKECKLLDDEWWFAQNLSIIPERITHVISACNRHLAFSIWTERVAMANWNLFTRWCKNYDLARLVKNEFSSGSEEESRKKFFFRTHRLSHSIITTTMKERIKSAPSLDSLEEPTWWCIIIKSSFSFFRDEKMKMMIFMWNERKIYRFLKML